MFALVCDKPNPKQSISFKNQQQSRLRARDAKLPLQLICCCSA